MKTKTKTMAFKKIKDKKETGKKANSKEETNETVFPKGVIVSEPHKNAPDFIKANILISMADFVEFAEQNPECLQEHEKYGQQMHLQLKESKGGKLYIVINNYKKA